MNIVENISFKVCLKVLEVNLPLFLILLIDRLDKAFFKLLGYSPDLAILEAVLDK